MELEQELEHIKQEIIVAKSAFMDTEINTVASTGRQGAINLIKSEQQGILQGQEAKDIANRIGLESIKADFASEAARINQKNIETAEKQFDTETRKRRLQRLNKELDLQHFYNMKMIGQNGKHKQMLDRRKKLVERFGYLYDMKEGNCFTAQDGEGKEYKVPKDFSFSEAVNRFRQFGRNISKLDKPLLQTLKWGLIIGAIVAGIFILKGIGIIR